MTRLHCLILGLTVSCGADSSTVAALAEPPEAPAPAVVERAEPDPVKPTQGFNVVARRNGEMWLHRMGNGTMLVSAGPELLVAESGVAMQRHPERLRGLIPPSEYSRWTVQSVGGDWPDSTFMVVSEFIGCQNPHDEAYRWTGTRWQRISGPAGPLARTYGHFSALGPGRVLSRPIYELSNESRFAMCGVDDPLPRRLERALDAKARPRFSILGSKGRVDGPKIPADRVAFAGSRMGDIYAVVKSELWHWLPDAKRPRRLEIPNAKRMNTGHYGAKIFVLASSRVVLRVNGEDGPGALLRYDGQRFHAIEPPPDVEIDWLAQYGNGPLWATSYDWDGKGGLFRQTVDRQGWIEESIPTVSFPSDVDYGGWADDPSSVDLPAAQVELTADDEVWVLAYKSAGGPGMSALLHNKPAPKILDVPDYDALREDTIRANPK